MSKLTRRHLLFASVTTGAVIGVASANANTPPEKRLSLAEMFIPEQLTTSQIRDSAEGGFTKLECAGSTFWVRCIGFGDGVPHTFIGIYASDKEGVFQRCVSAESWAAGNIEATIDTKTSMLELREVANSPLRGALILSINLKTIGTQHSIVA